MVFPALSVPKLIHRTSSPFNKKIEVFQVGNIRRLSVNGVVQSISWTEPSVQRRFWGRVEGYVFENYPKARNILMLGMGGGTMLHLFNRDMPQTHITVVEIDSEMVKVAEEFFDIKSLSNYSVINEDVMRVLTRPDKYDLHRGTFDCVVIDIFCGLNFPDLGSSGSFLLGVRSFIRSGGGVVVNRIYIDELKHEVDEFIDNFKDYFVEVGTSAISGRTNADNLLVYGKVK